jgi:hypothetical protein
MGLFDALKKRNLNRDKRDLEKLKRDAEYIADRKKLSIEKRKQIEKINDANKYIAKTAKIRSGGRSGGGLLGSVGQMGANLQKSAGKNAAGANKAMREFSNFDPLNFDPLNPGGKQKKRKRSQKDNFF